jgi:hypothetical protein
MVDNNRQGGCRPGNVAGEEVLVQNTRCHHSHTRITMVTRCHQDR